MPTTERIDLRRLIAPSARGKELSTRRNAFARVGFSTTQIANFEAERPTLYSPLVLEDRIRGLQELGFDPLKIPRMIRTEPTILGYTATTIKAKIESLEELGIKKPRKMIESAPAVLVRGLETVKDRIAVVQELGFSDPQGIIEGCPGILGLSRDTINNKFSELQTLGFTDLHGMIEKFPNTLSYSIGNIRRRLQLLRGLIDMYNKNPLTNNVPFTAQELMEKHTALFSTKIDKIVVLARVLAKTAQGPQDITNTVISGLIFSNLEDVLLAVDMIPDGEDVNPEMLLKMVSKIKARGYTKEEKTDRIAEGLKQDSKIRRRYFRGYPQTRDTVIMT